MKVGTDGVLTGAWAKTANVESALDIGTGTGLIALMLAQRNKDIKIDAIDINAEAIGQAKENVKNSPFATQVNCMHITLQEFEERNDKKYDLIISNPPFFIQSLKSPDDKRTLARHTDSLYINELIEISSGMLNETGKLVFIYPYDHKQKIIKYARESNLHISRIINVYPTPVSSPKRILFELSKSITTPEETNLIIEKERHIYSEEFSQLVKDFYLNL